MTEILDIYRASTASGAKGIARMRVLLYGFSGRGFPGGDGVLQAIERLPELSVHAVYTHAADPEILPKLAADYDLAIICNTRIGELLKAPPGLWECAPLRALWFWDLRPGFVAGALAGRVTHAFLSYRGAWEDPKGGMYDPAQWRDVLGVPVFYMPQGAPLREPESVPDAPRVVFVGDLGNPTYHAGRAAVCRSISATVVNRTDRAGRLEVEARLPGIYRSASYTLSMSPLAPGYTSVRTYSILACGGTMLLHRFPEAERLFRDGEHAILFDDSKELRARLAELDPQPDERRRIGDNGRKLHASRHTVTHRILNICRIMVDSGAEFSGWL